ncbi:glycoside hydrolase family 15 protein [Candidatus Chloroploca asiatica]|uniref:Glucoamylase n=1 Tax=Candidatus Chloroploca asiatica TaxID=1506545 RepID=A0A2H3KR18_9CHLR|nr:glycoside hydrolase family 15 protein [Candidatus Chloroploca asiatica]PDW00858.1 glucoamylase [Candidatus Chloroploca asiatica]
MPYQPIENYGVIGDMHSVALIAMNGSLDWLCFPHFDSPAVFAAILDDARGGRFQIEPIASEIRHKQFYWPDTNVLVTRFYCAEGVGEVVDFMPVGRAASSEHVHQVIRRVGVVRGTMRFRMRCAPAFNYARDAHTMIFDGCGVIFRTPALSLVLTAPIQMREENDAAIAEFTLNEQETIHFVLEELQQTPPVCPPAAYIQHQFEATVDYWHRWLAQCTYTGRWREIVYRSALALKLLTFAPTGAIVAAATCSLPEEIGGVRNWDYRYTWIRDAAFTLYALMRIGFTEEAQAFMQWVEARCHELEPDGSLQIMYGIDGRHTLVEEELDHLEGYRQSRPVRIGNGAYNQLQLDIYGELLDAVYLFNKHGAPISYDLWCELRRMINWVCANWHRKDEGIWEVRGEPQHFVYSKLMCWVAIDRGLRIAEKRSFPAERDTWLRVRDQIFEEIMEQGWSDEHQAFMQFYGSDTLDASNLMMPLVFFVAANDPRMRSTLKAIMRSPAEGGLLANSLVYRYDPAHGVDGLPGEEGAFNICTFWLVEALTRASVTEPALQEQARLIFERMLTYANHVGLYAEQTGARGEALGNFPQAFTHLALISAAVNLDHALGGER